MGQRLLSVATKIGLRLFSGKIRSGPAKGLRFEGGDTVGYVLGASEPAVQQTLVRFLGEGGVFYDIGANIGFMTVLGCRLVGPTGRVHAFEPLEQNAAMLRQNLEANGFFATVHPIALSDTEGPVTMVIEQQLGRAYIGEGDVQVPAFRLDDLELPPPDLVKIDVEGSESVVLEGMRGTVARHRPAIVVEIHVDQEQPVRKFFDELGYTVEELDSGGMPHLLAT